jgi:hypothetical protein
MVMTGVVLSLRAEIGLMKKAYEEGKRVMDLRGLGSGIKLAFHQSSIMLLPVVPVFSPVI